MGAKKYSCPCCGYKVFDNPSPGNDYAICPICFWEDDPIGFDVPEEECGCNGISLIEAQTNFEEFGACRKDMVKNVRQPNENDSRGKKRIVGH
ncbi:CPCC family cysteine-rich protein [Zooshikella harenae]|uniref:Cysteine-rich CPCC domain-containing protein n=1 Tax=Zooshikella harenae TaxID=2827238 RepID=A0ABS5ZJR5_9GAMM|nr:CPCC family cysteine-rich protein [Zooshikella harenae]MBU2714133.1 hypothetical protein [Zooshikella harenae]